MTEYLVVSRRTRDPRCGRAKPARLWGSAGATTILFVVAQALFTIAGCGTTGGSSTGSGSPSTNSTSPAHPAGTIALFPLPDANFGARGITAGPDDNLWFTKLDPPAEKLGASPQPSRGDTCFLPSY